MGRITLNFRQSKSSLSGNRGAQKYTLVNRMGSWYGKISNLLKVRGRGGENV
jgi:hypothetical protein